MARMGACEKRYINNGPMAAVKKFLEMNKQFEIDKYYNKLHISYSPNRYLRRINYNEKKISISKHRYARL